MPIYCIEIWICDRCRKIILNLSEEVMWSDHKIDDMPEGEEIWEYDYDDNSGILLCNECLKELKYVH